MLNTAEHQTTPETWAASLGGPPAVCSDVAGWRSGLLRRWTSVPGAIRQPPIDHHYVVLHLGGPKQVTRTGEGRTVRAQVAEGALTLVPAGTRYDWSTVGPIDFAHLYVHPSRLNSFIASRFDRDPAAVTLDEQVGFEDPLLAILIREMLDQVSRPGAGSGAYLDCMLDLAVAHLAHRHSTLSGVTPPARHALAPARLRRVLSFAEQRLAEPLALADLAKVAGLSRFHFSRAFRNATGEPPLAYLTRQRVEAAKRLLRETDLPMTEVARRSGHTSPSQFATSFRRRTGQTPSHFRRWL